MIRKFGHVDASPEEARRIALAVESWPEWMPDIRSTRVLERSERRILAEVHRRQGRSVHRSRLELVRTPTGHIERQVSGLARKWEGDWQFRRAPNGAGTVASCKQEVDLGFFGIFVPPRTVQRVLDRTFEGILRGLEDQALKGRGTKEAAAREPGSTFEGLRRIRILATESELEIWLVDEKYVAQRVG